MPAGRELIAGRSTLNLPRAISGFARKSVIAREFAA
jgi:hypothetical protein